MATALNNNILEFEVNEDIFREKYEFLIAVLPDANPVYLREMCKEYYEDEYEFQRFIRKALKKKQYPRRKDYDRELEIAKQKEFYKSNFKVEEFLKIIPNPEEYFSETNNKRMRKIKNFNNDEIKYAETYLKNYFQKLSVKTVTTSLMENSYDMIKTIEYLKNCPVELKKKRNTLKLPDEEQITPDLLQEVAYIEKQFEILSYIENKKLEKQFAIAEARIANLLSTCDCCFDEQVLPGEIITCENGHKFCLVCTKTGCEIAAEEGQQEFRCFADCNKFFDIQDLERVLHPKVYSNICKSKQLKEIKSAKLENLECCPHCEFAAIVPPEIKVFKCLNPECLKETCRLCKQLAHVPLRCEEVEVAEDVRKRTYLEDKMTEALIRICCKCNLKFLKEDGCNKMTCRCGASMCYVCKQPVTDYKHFNGDGGDQYHLCPLYSDTNKLHAKNVLDETIKLRDSIRDEDTKLKIDPTKDIETFYRRRTEKKRKHSCRCENCNA